MDNPALVTPIRPPLVRAKAFFVCTKMMAVIRNGRRERSSSMGDFGRVEVDDLAGWDREGLWIDGDL